MSIRAIIVDDEELARRGIKLLLNRFTDVEIAAECRNGREAICAIRDERPDLVFLDVQMPGQNGFDVMAECSSDAKPYVIFVTAYDQYAVKAFDVHALDYLLKPIDEQRFDAALERARQALARARDTGSDKRFAFLTDEVGPTESSGTPIDRIAVKSGGKLLVLRLRDVDWVSAEQDYVALHIGPKTYLLRDTIGSLQKKMAVSGFGRIHRSTLVNADRVRELHPLTKGEYTVILNDGTELKLSRNFRDGFAMLAGYGGT